MQAPKLKNYCIVAKMSFIRNEGFKFEEINAEKNFEGDFKEFFIDGIKSDFPEYQIEEKSKEENESKKTE